MRDADQGEPLRALLGGDRGRARAHREPTPRSSTTTGSSRPATNGSCRTSATCSACGRSAPVESAGVSARAYVANTIAYRRRKGTAVVLEQLARDVTGWPARAVEFFTRLATTQHMNHVRLAPTATPGVRDAAAAELADGAVRSVRAHARSAQRARPAAGATTSRTSASSCGGCAATRWAPATPGDESPDFVSARDLGAWWSDPSGRLDAPLFNKPRTETTITHLAEEENVPGELRRLALNAELERLRRGIATPAPRLHDRGRSGAARVRAPRRRERAGRGAARGHLPVRDPRRRGARLAGAARARARPGARPHRIPGRPGRAGGLGAEQLRILRRPRRRPVRPQRRGARGEPGDRASTCPRPATAGGFFDAGVWQVGVSHLLRRRRQRHAVRIAARRGRGVEPAAAGPHRRDRADGQPDR